MNKIQKIKEWLNSKPQFEVIEERERMVKRKGPSQKNLNTSKVIFKVRRITDGLTMEIEEFFFYNSKICKILQFKEDRIHVMIANFVDYKITKIEANDIKTYEPIEKDKGVVERQTSI